MTNARISLFLAGILICCLLGNLRAEVSKEKINTLYTSLNDTYWCGNSMMGIGLNFYKDVPRQDRSDVLAQMIERAVAIPKDSAVIVNTFELVEGLQLEGPLVLSKRLEIDLLKQAHHPDKRVREMLFNFLFRHFKEDYRSLILSGLEDPDEMVRQRALDSVRKWSDARQICQDYTQKNSPEGEHKESFIGAMAVTHPEDAERAHELFVKSGEPHALALYNSYIVLHKGDRAYAVSVNCAESARNRILEDFDFYAKRAENPKSQDTLKHNEKVISKFGGVSDVTLDDWGNNWGINGEMTYGEYGSFQYKVKGSKGSGLVREAWHYREYQFEVTKIDEVTPEGMTTTLWALEDK